MLPLHSPGKTPSCSSVFVPLPLLAPASSSQSWGPLLGIVGVSGEEGGVEETGSDGACRRKAGGRRGVSWRRPTVLGTTDIAHDVKGLGADGHSVKSE